MNTFYHGDCLFVLKHDIPPESVDLIYLDPPFFTGKVQKGMMKWEPGAMEVSYEDSRRFWSEKADEMREKSPAWLRHIALKRPDFASYLWYMMQRLQACHKVLKKTGSIYLHCDYRASHYLKMVMDEVFGDRSFLNEVIIHYTAVGLKAKSRKFHQNTEPILSYAKTRGKHIWNDVIIPAEPRRASMHVWNPQTKKADRVRNSEGRIQYFTLAERKADSLIELPAIRGKEKSGYPTQKPEALLERFIKASSNEGDLVLDPFCGCGTSVIVASKLNRQFIGIDIHPTAFEVIKNRGHELFTQSRYVSRDLEEVSAMNPREFEDWVNEFYRATKPYPDRGVDGVTHDGVPIQVKTFQIKYDTIDKLLSSSKFHPLVPKPINRLIFVSQTGFDDGARKRKFEIETAEGIEVILATPEQMLSLE